MRKHHLLIPKSIAIILYVAMLFSCQNRIGKVRQMEEQSFGPQTEQKDMNLVYTDSGKVVVRLLSPNLLDYTHLAFPYREFPEGLKLEFYDEDNLKNTVEADYAINYEQSGLVDLQGNVKIVTGDSTVLTARQLYWDQNRQWLFTDLDYTLKMNDGTINNGNGFDARQNFDNFISRSNIGTRPVEDKPVEDKKE